MCMSCVYVVCGVCGGTRDVADQPLMLGGVWGSANELGANGAAALAGALSKLVYLTSLDLQCTWNVEWVVSCVFVVCCVCV